VDCRFLFFLRIEGWRRGRQPRAVSSPAERLDFDSEWLRRTPHGFFRPDPEGRDAGPRASSVRPLSCQGGRANIAATGGQRGGVRRKTTLLFRKKNPISGPYAKK